MFYIEVCSWFIEQQHTRLLCQSSCYVNNLLLPATQFIKIFHRQFVKMQSINNIGNNAKIVSSWFPLYIRFSPQQNNIKNRPSSYSYASLWPIGHITRQPACFII